MMINDLQIGDVVLTGLCYVFYILISNQNKEA